MRIIVGVAALVAALAVAEGAAEACKHQGKVLFRRTQAPLEGHTDSVPDSTLEIYATGAWSWVQEMPDGQEPASQGGCLSKKHLAELKRALARATFTQGEPDTCDAVPERSLEYASPKRKKKVRITLPCGTTDATTDALAACAQLAASGGRPSSKEIRDTCRVTKLDE